MLLILPNKHPIVTVKTGIQPHDVDISSAEYATGCIILVVSVHIKASTCTQPIYSEIRNQIIDALSIRISDRILDFQNKQIEQNYLRDSFVI